MNRIHAESENQTHSVELHDVPSCHGVVERPGRSNIIFNIIMDEDIGRFTSFLPIQDMWALVQDVPIPKAPPETEILRSLLQDEAS